MLRRIRGKLASEDGFSVAELVVGAALGSVLLVLLGTFLVGSMNAGAFTDGESATINDARNALIQVERDVRGADSIVWCTPTTSCLQVEAQALDGSYRTIRYKYVSASLTREIYNDATNTWSAPSTVVERVENSGSQPVFSCDTQSSLLRLTIDLYIEPTPHSNPLYEVQTSVRPRNFPSKASCP